MAGSTSATETVPGSLNDTIFNLPGDNLWKLSSVAKALGLKTSELHCRLKGLYPTDWNSELGVVRLRVMNRNELCIPPKSVRVQNALAKTRRADKEGADYEHREHVTYDYQALIDLVHLINDNQDAVVAALYQQYGRSVLRPDNYEDCQDDFRDALIPALSEISKKGMKSSVAILTTCEPARWFTGTLFDKRKMLIKTVLELCSTGFLNPECFKVQGFAQSAPIEEIYANHFALLQPAAPAPMELTRLANNELRPGYQRRQALRGDLPLIFSPLSLKSCDVRVVALLEHLLTLDFPIFDLTVREDSTTYSTRLKELMITAFSDTGLSSPFRANTGTGIITGGELVILAREIDVSFDKHHQKLRQRLATCIAQRRENDSKIVRACCGVPADPAIPLLENLRRQRSKQTDMQPGAVLPTPLPRPRLPGDETGTVTPLSQRKKQSGPLGGRPGTSDSTLAFLRYLLFTTLTSQRKAGVLLFATGAYFLGVIPDKDEVPSESLMRYGNIRLYLANLREVAQRLYRTLIRYPFAKVTGLYDGTPLEGTTRQSVFLRFPLVDDDDESESYPQHYTYFISFPISSDKTARSQAEVVLAAIIFFGDQVEGLTILILLAYIGDVVDHAALSQAKQLWKAMDSELDKRLAAKNKSKSDFITWKVLRNATGDSFHKLALPIMDLLVYTYGRNRGSQTEVVVGHLSQALDMAYYQRKDVEKARTLCTSFMGFSVNLLQNVVKQRWENEGKMAAQLLKWWGLESKIHRGHCMFPHFFLSEIHQYTKSSYQFKLLARVGAAGLNPLVYIALVFVDELHSKVWTPANYEDRQRSRYGSPQGMRMREYLSYIHFTLIPQLEEAASNPRGFFPSTFTSIDGLPDYKHWTVMQPDPKVPGGSIPLRLGVPLAMKLSKEAMKLDPGAVLIGDGMLVDVQSMKMRDEVLEIECPVVKQPVSMNDQGGRVLDGSQLKEMKIGELTEGLEVMVFKLRKQYAEYYKSPHILMFMTVPGMGGAAMRFFIQMVLRHNPDLVPEEERGSFMEPDLERSRDRYFSSVFSRVLKGEELVLEEKLLVDWIESYSVLTDVSCRSEAAKLSHNTEEDHESDTDVRDFHVNYPKTHFRLGMSGDVAGQSNVKCEQSNNTLEVLSHKNEATITQLLKVAFHYNIMASINDETSGRPSSRPTGDGIKDRIGRAVDTHKKRIEHVRLALIEAEKYTASYMDGIPSIRELIKKGTRFFDEDRAKQVLKDVARRIEGRALNSTEVDDALEPYLLRLSPRDESYLIGQDDNDPSDEVRYKLTLEKHWASVPADIAEDEAKEALPSFYQGMLFLEAEVKAAHPFFYQHFWVERGFDMVSRWFEKDGQRGEGTDLGVEGGCLEEGLEVCTCRETYSAMSNIGNNRIIKCAGGACGVMFFHLRCLNRTRMPPKNRAWLCETCTIEAKGGKRKGRVMEQRETPATVTLQRSLALHPQERWTEKTSQKRTSARFLKRQLKGWLQAFLHGRDSKMKPGRYFTGRDEDEKEAWVEAKADVFPDMWPKSACTSCGCRHAGGIRCFLSYDESRNFMTACVRPYSHFLSEAHVEKERALAAQVLGERAEEEWEGREEHDEEEGIGEMLDMEEKSEH